MDILYFLLGILLLGVLLMLARTVYFTVKRRKRDKKIVFRAEKQQFYAERLARMLQCKTVSVKGMYDDTEFAKHREVLRELFPLLHEKAEMHIFGEDCYGYRIHGRDESRNILLMSHHDVVAAKGTWKYPPFDGVIAEDRLWGRGAVDTKTSLFAELTAVEELLARGELPHTNVWIVSSHNEELLGDGINKAVAYFREKKIEFEFAVDEGGGVVDLPMGSKTHRFAMIAVHEKGRHTVLCRTDKTPADKKIKAMSPTERMAALMHEVQSNRRLFRKKVSPILRELLETAGAYLPLPLRIATSNMGVFSPLLVWGAPKINRQAAQMLGTTCRWTAIRGGKFNRKNETQCEAEVCFRMMEQTDFECEFAAFQRLAEKYGVSVTEIPALCEYRDPADTDCREYALLREITAQVFPDAIVAPYINPAYTDARAVMDICRKTYRFVPVAMDEQQFGSMHNPDENVSLDAIANAVEFYARLLDCCR